MFPSFNETFPVPSTFAFSSSGVAYTVISVTEFGTVTSQFSLFLFFENPLKSYSSGFIPKFLNFASDDFVTGAAGVSGFGIGEVWLFPAPVFVLLFSLNSLSSYGL